MLNPEPETLSDPSPALPPAPVMAGSRYPPPIAAAIDRLLEMPVSIGLFWR